MSLTNAQYDEIMRQYSRKQLKAQETARKKKKQLYSQAPELSQIDAAIASVSVSCARSYIQGEKSALEHIDEKIQTLSQKKEEILASLGSSSKDLEPAYECPLCKDTGYINGQKCRCFKQAEIDLVYEQSNIRSVLQKENFQNFRLSYYSDEIRDPANGLTSLECCQLLQTVCGRLSDRSPEPAALRKHRNRKNLPYQLHCQGTAGPGIFRDLFFRIPSV